MTPKKFYNILLALTIGGTLLFMAGGVYAWTKLNNLSRQAYEKEVILDNSTVKASILKNLKATYEDVKSDFEEVLFAFPEEKDIDRVMTDLEADANKAGVKFSAFAYFEPKTTGKKKKKVVVTDLSLTQTIKRDDFYEIPLQVKVEGSYESVMSFLRSVENSRRLMSVQNIDFAKDEVDPGDPLDVVIATFDTRVYMKK